MRTVPVPLFVLLAAAAFAAGCTRRPVPLLAGQGEPARTPGFETRLRAEVRAGPASGYLQTPKGGQPGTTSLGRPTFDEVGAETLFAPTADVRFAFGHHRVHVGGSWGMLHGDETLTQGLTSWDQTYPAGTRVTSDTDILSTWLGYGYAFELGGQRGAFTLTPGLGVYGYSQRYAISGGGKESTRDFDAFSPMFDSELLWYPGGRVHLSASLMLVLDDALGLSSPTTVVDTAVRLHWDISRKANVFLAAGYSRIEHHDEQPVPNDAQVEALPWFGIGAEFRF